MSTALLIFQNVPESNYYYVLQDLNMEAYEVLKLIHGKLVNSDEFTEEEDSAFEKVNNTISVDPEYYYGDSATTWGGRFVESKIEEKDVWCSGPFEYVFITGMML